MNIATVPTAQPLVNIVSFSEWKTYYDGPNYVGQLTSLGNLERALGKDPIEYITHLSKVDHNSDQIIAEELNKLMGGNIWNLKKVFTLRKQCGIVGNDHRQANRAKLLARPEQPKPIQEKVEYYKNTISKIVAEPIIQNHDINEMLQILLKKLDFDSIDAFFQKMREEVLGERPIKAILDALYDHFSLPAGKGKRVGSVYIRSKLAAIKALTTENTSL